MCCFFLRSPNENDIGLPVSPGGLHTCHVVKDYRVHHAQKEPTTDPSEARNMTYSCIDLARRLVFHLCRPKPRAAEALEVEIKTTYRSRRKCTRRRTSSVLDVRECTVVLPTCIQCDICAATFDQQRSTLPAEVFTILLTIIKCHGWFCYSYYTFCKVRLDKIQADQSTITD